VTAIEVRDPREQALPDVGHLALVDPETGRRLYVDTRRTRVRDEFARVAAAERGDLARELAQLGVSHCVLSTDGDWLGTLTAFLSRELRRR
jgi:uncharacterized protein (DUF58 family)